MAKKYGWYSELSVLAGHNTVWYGTMNNECVECSFINNDQYFSNSGWIDVICVGEIDSSKFYGRSAPQGIPVFTPYARLNSMGSSSSVGSFLDEDPLLFNEDNDTETEFIWGTYKRLETYFFDSEVFYLVEDRLNYKKWLCHSDINRLIGEVGSNDAMSVAFYDADIHFEPPGYSDELL